LSIPDLGRLSRSARDSSFARLHGPRSSSIDLCDHPADRGLVVAAVDAATGKSIHLGAQLVSGVNAATTVDLDQRIRDAPARIEIGANGGTTPRS
jgi:hypothetical protein